MSEKRMLNCIMIEGIMLVVLSLCVLILPKLTSLSYGVMLAATFIAYGFYKIIHSIINKEYGLKRIFPILIGIFLSTIGILILLVPKINLFWLIALIGVYFIIESISSIVYGMKLRSVYHFWQSKLVCGGMLFLAGLLIVLGVPVMSFWMVTVISGIALLIKGMTKLVISLGNLCNCGIN